MARRGSLLFDAIGGGAGSGIGCYRCTLPPHLPDPCRVDAPGRWEAMTEAEKREKAETWGEPAPGAVSECGSGCNCPGCGGK